MQNVCMLFSNEIAFAPIRPVGWLFSFFRIFNIHSLLELDLIVHFVKIDTECFLTRKRTSAVTSHGQRKKKNQKKEKNTKEWTNETELWFLSEWKMLWVFKRHWPHIVDPNEKFPLHSVWWTNTKCKPNLFVCFFSLANNEKQINLSTHN